jgi:hypothetical protein
MFVRETRWPGVRKVVGNKKSAKVVFFAGPMPRSAYHSVVVRNELQLAVGCFSRVAATSCWRLFTQFVKHLRWSDGVDLDGSLGGTDIAGCGWIAGSMHPDCGRF